MDFQTIYNLSESIPSQSRYFDIFEEGEINDSSNSEEVHRFALCYKDLSFGWHFIKSFADSELDLPVCVINEETLIRAYNFERYSNRDIEIAQAIAIETSLPKNIKNTIVSLFFADDTDIDRISSIVGFTPEVIKIYEELFFNVLDRKEDAMFVAGLVYPETRAEEFSSNYIHNVDNGTLLKRVAYNSGTESVLALAGFKDNFLNYSDAANNTNKLESAIMSNAYFMAVCGFLNSRDSTGIVNAKNIMAAAKHGGGDENTFQETGVGAAPMGTIIINELMDSQKIEISQRLERTKNLQEAEVIKSKEAEG